MMRRRAILLAGSGLLPGVAARAAESAGGPASSPAGMPSSAPVLRAPNVVPVTPRIVTSGQPDARALSTLAAAGFGAVVSLAPPTVGDAVHEEAVIVGRQGLVYANLPIPFDRPGAGDYAAFAGLMSGLADRKVLVHCQVNLRASTMTFLYRVIALQEDPSTAYEAVSRVWVPQGAWREFMLDTLRRHGIAFDPD